MNEVICNACLLYAGTRRAIVRRWKHRRMRMLQIMLMHYATHTWDTSATTSFSDQPHEEHLPVAHMVNFCGTLETVESRCKRLIFSTLIVKLGDWGKVKHSFPITYIQDRLARMQRFLKKQSTAEVHNSQRRTHDIIEGARPLSG